MQGYRVISGLLEIYRPLLNLPLSDFTELVEKERVKRFPIETRDVYKRQLFLVPGNAFGWLLPAGSLGAAVTLLIIMIAAGRGGFSPHRMLLAGMALSTAFTMLLMMLQASGDPRMAQVLTWISGSTYNATDAQVWRTGIVMVILLAITPLCRRWLTILPLGGDTARAVGMAVSYTHLLNLFLSSPLKRWRCISLSR